MTVCGVAGGIGSIFKAPLGGAIFAVEVLYKRDLEVEALIPSFISSVVAYSVFSVFFGFKPVFSTPKYSFMNPLTLIFYAALGVICALLGRFYVTVFYWIQYNVFTKLNVPNYMKPAIGGIMLGILALFIPEVLGTGYGWLQMAIHNQLPYSQWLPSH